MVQALVCEKVGQAIQSLAEKCDGDRLKLEAHVHRRSTRITATRGNVKATNGVLELRCIQWHKMGLQ
jgi:hypothetical protein